MIFEEYKHFFFLKSSQLKQFSSQKVHTKVFESLLSLFSQWRIYYHRMWGQLSTTCSKILKQPNGELLVAVGHNHIHTMASETVYPIDWSHSPPLWAVPPEPSCIVKSSATSAGIEVATGACEATTGPMRPMRVLYIYIFIYLYINHSSLRSDNKLSHCLIKREHS